MRVAYQSAVRSDVIHNHTGQLITQNAILGLRNLVLALILKQLIHNTNLLHYNHKTKQQLAVTISKCTRMFTLAKFTSSHKTNETLMM